MFSTSQTGALVKQNIADPDYQLIAEFVMDKTYLQICDFDDHLENVNNDWRNKNLFD